MLSKYIISESDDYKLSCHNREKINPNRIRRLIYLLKIELKETPIVVVICFMNSQLLIFLYCNNGVVFQFCINSLIVLLNDGFPAWRGELKLKVLPSFPTSNCEHWNAPWRIYFSHKSVDTLQEPLASLKEVNVSEAVQAETGTSAWHVTTTEECAASQRGRHSHHPHHLLIM